MIRTPSDLTGYLYALALQLPDVAHVITGEGSRQEESTKSTARYPQVLIETPEASIPLSGDQKAMSTRIYVLAMSQGSTHAHEDQATDRAYRIAEAFISAIRAHALSEDHGFSLTRDDIEITPVIARGSDQLRGWTFDPGIMVDQSCGEYDADTFYMPQFTWANSEEDPHGASITITDTSIHGDEDATDMYWQEEYDQPEATTFPLLDGIRVDVILDGPAFRIIHVWMRMTGSHTLWAYARIDSRETTGRSTPFVTIYPI